MYISPYCRLVLVPPIFMELGTRGQLTDVITCVKFLVDRFRGYGVLIPPKLPFPIYLLRRPYNSVALPFDTVIRKKPKQKTNEKVKESQNYAPKLWKLYAISLQNIHCSFRRLSAFIMHAVLNAFAY